MPSATIGSPKGSRAMDSGTNTASVAVGVPVVMTAGYLGKRSNWFPLVLAAQISPVFWSMATPAGLDNDVSEKITGGLAPAVGTTGKMAIRPLPVSAT